MCVWPTAQTGDKTDRWPVLEYSAMLNGTNISNMVTLASTNVGYCFPGTTEEDSAGIASVVQGEDAAAQAEFLRAFAPGANGGGDEDADPNRCGMWLRVVRVKRYYITLSAGRVLGRLDRLPSPEPRIWPRGGSYAEVYPLCSGPDHGTFL